MAEVVRVILADDHASVRSGLALILNSSEHIEVVGQAGTAQGALELCQAGGVDVAILDIRMPGDGVWAAGQITSLTPVRALMLTTYADDELIRSALAAGASGYLLKTVTGPELIAAVQHVGAGRHVVDPHITAGIIASYQAEQGESTAGAQGSSPDQVKLLELLTARELDVLKLIASGRSNHQIARVLEVSLATVKTHISAIYQKTHLESRVQLGFLGQIALTEEDGRR